VAIEGTAQDVHAADLDGDGDLDLLVAPDAGNEVVWYESDGASPPGWTRRSLAATAGPWSSVATADLDLDGDLDAIGTDSGAGLVGWWENGGGSFAERPVATGAGGPRAVFPADFDRDGDPDLLVALGTADQIVWRENRGGQFAFATGDVSPAIVLDGEAAVLLDVVLDHRGRTGDEELAWSAAELVLERTPGESLAQSEADAWIDELRLYLDDGSGAFEPGIDAEVVSTTTVDPVEGRWSIPVPQGDPQARVAPGSPRRYFVELRTEADASYGTPSQILVSHGGDDAGSVEYADHSIPLDPSYSPAATATVLADRDTDGDGIPSSQDDDDDGDGVADGSDCASDDGTSWALPGEATDLRLSQRLAETWFEWAAPADPGGTAAAYDLLVSTAADDFEQAASCVAADHGATLVTSTLSPAPGETFHYLVRAVNACGDGTAGSDSADVPRAARICP
jgi:hypothetical protein